MVVVRNELSYVGPFKSVGGRKRCTFVWRAVRRSLKGRKKHQENRKKYSRRFREHARVKLCRTIFHRAVEHSRRPRGTRPRTGQNIHSITRRRRYDTFVPAVFPRVPDPFFSLILFYNSIRWRVLLLSLLCYYVIRMIGPSVIPTGRPSVCAGSINRRRLPLTRVCKQVFSIVPPPPRTRPLPNRRRGDGLYVPNVRTFSFLRTHSVPGRTSTDPSVMGVNSN